MASLVPGYTYDIFISYRQKDNKYDGWVTEFAEHLQGELESTFKEEPSVYFDNNPHDGLLETDDVDASLTKKLKCLVFIPVVSRTYCDPRSYAWTNEMIPFIELASHDQHGLWVRLPGGTISCRVLPVRIHDIDDSDIRLYESALGGSPGGIEFIYKAAGVNRPLRPKEENPEDNVNKTYYRDQINKVALLIKEIILGLQKGDTTLAYGKSQAAEKPPEKVAEGKSRSHHNPFLGNWSKQKLIIAAVFLCLFASLVLYTTLFKEHRTVEPQSSENRITVVVMPFQNMTGDISWNIWQKSIQDNLVTSLSDYPMELEVRQTATVNNYIRSRNLSHTFITPSVASVISEDLNADIFIYGNIKRAGNILRISAQAIDTKTEEIQKSFQIEGRSGSEILPVIDSLSVIVRDYLVISVMQKFINPDLRPLISTPSSDAYRNAFYGLYAYFNKRDYPAACNWFKKAADRDTNFVVALVMLSNAFGDQQKYAEAKSWSLRASSKNRLATFQQKLFIDLNHATWFETPREEIRYLNQLLALDDQVPYFNYRLGSGYCKLMQFEEAVHPLEKSLELYNSWNLRPWWINNYICLGLAYHKTGRYKKEKNIYKSAEQHFPRDPLLTHRMAIYALAVGDSATANALVQKYITLRKGNSDLESDILSGVADIFSESGIYHKAEEYYRKALALEPDNHKQVFNLASFLVSSDRNNAEGSALVDELLDLAPDNYNYLELKGRVLFREKQYREALDMFERSWALRIKNAVYDHEAFLQLEASKKAVAGL